MLVNVPPGSESDTDDSVVEPAIDDLLERTATGDQAAFGELYDRLAPRVLGLIRRLVVDSGAVRRGRPGGLSRGLAIRRAFRSE